MPPLEDMEVRWAARLLHEHRAICLQHGVFLSSPTINISSGRSTLGCWDDRTKTISISSCLIQNEVWDIVLEVLKHEMAHQYISEQGDHADIHGRHFRHACRKLGVHPAFMTAGTNYARQLEIFKGTLPAEALKMTRKIKKLLALGRSGNEAEARAASAKAVYLLNKYNLEQTLARPDLPDVRYRSICHGKKRVESIQRAILSVLKAYYYVDCLTAGTYDAREDSAYKTVVLIGRPERLAVAEYVYHFLLDRSRALWRNFKNQTLAPAGDRVSFEMGFISGIQQNHRRMFKPAQVTPGRGSVLPEKAVLALREQAREENQIEISRLFPRLKIVRSGRHSTATDAYKKGFEEGTNTQVNPGMPCRESDPDRLANPVKQIGKPG